MAPDVQSTGRVVGIVANLVTIECSGPVRQNEICLIELEGLQLMAEVIRISGERAYAQVFESTRGLRSGSTVKFTGRLLEVELGPGLLSRKFDGLQNDLEELPSIWIKRGEKGVALNESERYEFKPILQPGDVVRAGDWLGQVRENWIEHRIMLPFAWEGEWRITKIASAGSYAINETIATVADEHGEERSVSMRQRWPVKLPIKSYRRLLRPDRLLSTGIRAIDTLNPLAEGGTGFIPGPFGCGKTVLQHAISKNADADLIIVTACGERANEVVELFEEFPELEDRRTGRKLMERTTIICNTSNMPVASREASIYTGMTIAEYYRAMGLKVLLLADSTSRWAQALREMSNRLEELPGPDAFPMDLSAVISNFYARAGLVELNNGERGSVTFVGTVSPAGGNLKEPVTESTKKAARSFYALSQKRADTRRYPAIEPLESYSKYLEYPELADYFNATLKPGWLDSVNTARNYLQRGQEAYDQINILGDDSVPLEYHILFWKSELLDYTILQQNAFDRIDSSTPLLRQEIMLKQVLNICDSEFEFEKYEEVAGYFKGLINALSQLKYCELDSEEYQSGLSEVNRIFGERTIKAKAKADDGEAKK